MIHAQYIVNGNVKRVSVVLSVKGYESLLDKMEELEDTRMYGGKN
jgi:hypothetical protein